MNGILEGIYFLVALGTFIVIAIYFMLIKDDSTVRSSKRILNKFKPDNTAPKLTKMIEFRKNKENLSKYIIE